jgi:tetratricopeptide (TPR) repeat protein
MAIKGSLMDLGIGDVCQLLSIGRKTGCLSVTDRSRFGRIFFDRGRITFATIVNRRDRLGDLLVREGAISHAQLMDGVAHQARQPDRRLGEILLDRGHIDRATLTACIQHQIEEAIYHLFTWRRGTFHFEAERSPDAREVLISVNPEMLLLEGARRIDEWTVMEKKIPSMGAIFVADRVRLEEARVRLTREQRLILPLMDGQRTVHQLAEGAGIEEFTAAKALYGLVQAGFASRVGQRDPGHATGSAATQDARNLGVAFYRTAMLEEAEREFRRVLQSDPGDAAASHYLALTALRQGDATRAASRLTALLESGGPRMGAYLNLAYALRRQRRFDEATRVLLEARHIAPTDARVRLAEAGTALFGGDHARAASLLVEYRQMLEPHAVAPATYFYCAALAEAVEGRLDRAHTIVEEGLGAHPASAPLLLLAGNLAERRADMDAAERSYQQAAEEDASLAQAHRNLGDLAQRRGAAQDALDHYRRAVEADPELGDGLYTRIAELYYRRNERDQALRCWRRAVELNPDNEVARNRLEVVAGVVR